MAKTNPLAKYLLDEKKAKLESLDGYEITYRDLTLKEAEEFSNRMIKDFKHGEPEIDLEEMNKIKYEKAALVLIDPKLPPMDELMDNYGSKMLDVINEINKLVEPDKKDEDEGNES